MWPRQACPPKSLEQSQNFLPRWYGSRAAGPTHEQAEVKWTCSHALVSLSLVTMSRSLWLCTSGMTCSLTIVSCLAMMAVPLLITALYNHCILDAVPCATV